MEQAEDTGGNLLTQFRAWRSRLSNADFSVVREQVHLKNPAQLEADPELAARFYRFIARHGLRPAPESEHRIAPMAAPVLGGLLIADEVIDIFLPVLFFHVEARRWRKLHKNAPEAGVEEGVSHE